MGEKYKLSSLGSDDKVRSIAFTNETEITIGSGLDADVRLQQPSVEENHVMVYFEQMKIRVLGNNVFLNEEALEKESVYGFGFGDVLRINRYRFMFSLTEPGDFVDEDKIIRRPTMELSYLNGEGRERPCLEFEKKEKTLGGESEKNEGIGEAVISIALNKVAGVNISLCKGEDGEGVSCVKQAIEEQKEVLNKEIKESIEISVVDTPVLPSMGRKNSRDLGEVMIEKEILDTAEKVVDEKMRNENGVIEEGLDELKQNVKDNIKEELREDLKREFMGDVKEDIREEVKEVLSSSDIKNAIASDVISRIELEREVNKEEERGIVGEEKKEDEERKEDTEGKGVGRKKRSSAMRLLERGSEENDTVQPRKASIRGRKRVSESSPRVSKKRKGTKKAKEKTEDEGPEPDKTKKNVNEE
ncbi:uncharacterized protein Eint_060780 [Encephalitozoon intestinalis ATCC 50506]|uniref:FHA domain-containing protein n=1 Tax=Encephalitozoon intestinalis (strain ATCC 50506) TaxID=876142 RepID=E0S7K7_ENCIT|nr:uncharacterized protein Eint_060780 [Encephalitozoon intestinalis ATCC 50506]ADM11686.1 hypothetical protein Eint_060780 [Encephalitozoon intestinalis ATCC 50506]UTX45423.1 hypothetical protein GPK93_06g09760 [Encephalitozoon intestinalis]